MHIKLDCKVERELEYEVKSYRKAVEKHEILYKIHSGESFADENFIYSSNFRIFLGDAIYNAEALIVSFFVNFLLAKKRKKVYLK